MSNIRAESAVEAVDNILREAVLLGASDAHIDPRPEGILVRLRVDGCISEFGLLPVRLHEEVIARLKILSGARTDLHSMPQDGRWLADIDGKAFNVRASFMPTYRGENAVLRLLPSLTDATTTSFASLGFTPDHARALSSAMRRAHGLVLVTGPTGSGKTTTLRACLSMKVREPLSIVTLEDPVEYEIPGVRQIHIRHSQGVTFAAGLRACLRQDPDVIMVGEIRDAETAAVAVHTALTGHLVLSTLHTNSAIESIPRLLDMGVDHYLLASTLKLIVAQRLVRRVCHDCDGFGCETCRMIGFKGRSVIAEAFEIDSGAAGLIGSRAQMYAIRAHAMSTGFRPIVEDGSEKVEWGITTRDEVAAALYEGP